MRDRDYPVGVGQRNPWTTKKNLGVLVHTEPNELHPFTPDVDGLVVLRGTLRDTLRDKEYPVRVGD